MEERGRFQTSETADQSWGGVVPSLWRKGWQMMLAVEPGWGTWVWTGWKWDRIKTLESQAKDHRLYSQTRGATEDLGVGKWPISPIQDEQPLSQLLWNCHLWTCSHSWHSLWLSAIGLASRSLPPLSLSQPLPPLSRHSLMTDSGFALISGPKELTSDVIPVQTCLQQVHPFRCADCMGVGVEG